MKRHFRLAWRTLTYEKRALTNHLWTISPASGIALGAAAARDRLALGSAVRRS